MASPLNVSYPSVRARFFISQMKVLCSGYIASLEYVVGGKISLSVATSTLLLVFFLPFLIIQTFFQ